MGTVPAPCPPTTATEASQGERSRDVHFGCWLSPSCRAEVARSRDDLYAPLSWAALDHVCPHWQSACVGFVLVVPFPGRQRPCWWAHTFGVAWQGGEGKGARPVWCWQRCRLAPPCLRRGASPPLGKQLAGGAWLSLPRPVGLSLGKKDLALVQQTLWPRADGDGCGFPLSPPFPLAEAHGWGELCVAHCGRVSPLGIAFWRGDPGRE